MTAIAYYRAIAVSQLHRAFNGVYRSGLCDTLWVDTRRIVYHHHAAHKVVASLAEGLDQSAAECLSMPGRGLVGSAI